MTATEYTQARRIAHLSGKHWRRRRNRFATDALRVIGALIVIAIVGWSNVWVSLLIGLR